MDLATRKLHLIAQLMSLGNPVTLEKIELFFKKEITSSADVWDEIPSEIQQLVEKGLEDVKNENVTPHAEVMESLKKEYNFIK